MEHSPTYRTAPLRQLSTSTDCTASPLKQGLPDAHGAKASAGGRLRGEAGTAIMAKAGLHRATAEISRLDEDVVAMLDGKLTRKRAASAKRLAMVDGIVPIEASAENRPSQLRRRPPQLGCLRLSWGSIERAAVSIETARAQLGPQLRGKPPQLRLS